MSYSYLLTEIGAFFFPFVLSFDKKVAFFRKWRYLLPAIIIAAIPLILWDIYFVNKGVWDFNTDKLIGITWFGLPLEEYLFFLFIPYSCIFIYEVLLAYFKLDTIPARLIKIVNWVLLLMSTVIFCMFIGRIYTMVVFGFILVIVTANSFIFHWKFTGPFYITYLVSLLPFIIVNGILTGSFGLVPICSYNSHEIIGLRLLQIPVEDIFYSLAMLYLVVIVYEWLKNKK